MGVIGTSFPLRLNVQHRFSGADINMASTCFLFNEFLIRTRLSLEDLPEYIMSCRTTDPIGGPGLSFQRISNKLSSIATNLQNLVAMFFVIVLICFGV